MEPKLHTEENDQPERIHAYHTFAGNTFYFVDFVVYLFFQDACAAGETDEYAYCKSVGALKSCDVGLGDVKVTHAWPKTILAGSCVPEQDYGYSTDKVWANNGCELIFSVCLGKFIIMILISNFCVAVVRAWQ